VEAPPSAPDALNSSPEKMSTEGEGKTFNDWPVPIPQANNTITEDLQSGTEELFQYARGEQQEMTDHTKTVQANRDSTGEFLTYTTDS